MCHRTYRLRIFNHPMIYQICDVMMSHSSLTHQTWSIDRYKQGKYFSEIFWTIWRTGTEFQALFNLATCSSYSLTNYVKFLVFHFFKRVNKGEWKWQMPTVKIWQISLYYFIKILKEPGTSLPSPAWRKKHIGNVYYKIH